MNMKKTVVLFLLFFVYCTCSAQYMTPEQYINEYKELAIREMKRMGVPASITLAQGILETESGNSDLVKKSNNHFGIKCKSSWSGGSVSHDDDANGECFRKYNTAEESYRDHSNFLRGSERYASLFKLSPDDYKGWAHGLKKAGYATNPAYPAILIKNIEKYNLNQYTLEGSSEVPIFKDSEFEDEKTTSAADKASTSETDASPVYNEQTKFNGLRALYAKAGTSLLAIATQQNISLARLLEFNDLASDGLLQEDSWIFLEKKLVQGNRDYHVTGKEETLQSVAQANGVQVAYLLKYNEFPPSATLRPGTRVALRPTTLPQKTVPGDLRANIHKVQPKEGLYAISKKYNVSMQDLRDWNSLQSDDLKIGQQLIISK